MPGIIIACHGMSHATGQAPAADRPDVPLDVDAQTKVTRAALELKRDAQVRIRRIVCSEATCAYQTALVMGLVLDIPMGAIRRDKRLRECPRGEDALLALSRHLAAIMDHGHGLLDSNKAGLLVIGHPLGLKHLSSHFRQPSDLPAGGYCLLRF